MDYRYFATAIEADILECCYGNVIGPSRCHHVQMTEMLNNIQKHFEGIGAKAGM